LYNIDRRAIDKMFGFLLFHFDNVSLETSLLHSAELVQNKKTKCTSTQKQYRYASNDDRDKPMLARFIFAAHAWFI